MKVQRDSAQGGQAFRGSALDRDPVDVRQEVEDQIAPIGRDVDGHERPFFRLEVDFVLISAGLRDVPRGSLDCDCEKPVNHSSTLPLPSAILFAVPNNLNSDASGVPPDGTGHRRGRGLPRPVGGPSRAVRSPCGGGRGRGCHPRSRRQTRARGGFHRRRPAGEGRLRALQQDQASAPPRPRGPRDLEHFRVRFEASREAQGSRRGVSGQADRDR